MRHVLPAELASRWERLTRDQRQPCGRRASIRLEQVRLASRSLTDFFYRQFDNRDRHVDLLDAFRDWAASILGFSDDVQLSSLNAQIAAARLQDTGASLGAVADLMHPRSNATAVTIDGMSAEIEAVRGVQETLALDLAIATLQGEAIGQFVDELIQHESTPDRGAREVVNTPINVAALAIRPRTNIAPMLDVLDDLERRFERMVDAVEQLEWELRQLGALQVAGRVEPHTSMPLRTSA